LGRTKDDVDVKKAVDQAQAYYNAQEKPEWVEWAGKILMLRLHAQMAMEQADTMRAEQEALEEMQRQDEEEQQEWEWAEKEAEWEKREAEFIRQVEAKEIDDEQFRELVNELNLERAMAESVAEGPATMQATTQDGEVGESEREESAEEEPAAAERVVESSTVGKGKRKAAPTRAKVYAAVDGPVSTLTSHRQYTLTNTLTVRPMFDAEDTADVHHDATRTAVQEMPNGQEPMLVEGEQSRSCRGGGLHHAQEVEGGAGDAG
jgi:hypothetical protein